MNVLSFWFLLFSFSVKFFLQRYLLLLRNFQLFQANQILLPRDQCQALKFQEFFHFGAFDEDFELLGQMGYLLLEENRLKWKKSAVQYNKCFKIWGKRKKTMDGVHQTSCEFFPIKIYFNHLEFEVNCTFVGIIVLANTRKGHISFHLLHFTLFTFWSIAS